MDRALLLAVLLAALLAVAPAGPPREGRPSPGAAAASAEAVEYGTEYGDDDDEDGSDDAYEDEYASSGEREQPGDKPLPEEAGQDAAVLGLRRGRHVQHHVVSHPAPRHQRPDMANKVASPGSGLHAGSAAPRVVFEETPADGCPPLALASTVVRRGDARCSAARCSRDSDCGAHDRLCCFNGCVKTCQLIANPPLVVDWEGETPDVLHPEMPVPLLDGRKSWPRPWPHLEPAQYNHGAPETMVLPGGCTLPPKQYQRIVAFMKAGGVRKCACSSGAVVCHVD